VPISRKQRSADSKPQVAAGTLQQAAAIRAWLEITTTRTKALNVRYVRKLAEAARHVTDPDGCATPQLAQELQRIERAYSFTPKARRLFQNFLGSLGIDSSYSIQVPADDRPYWMRTDHPLTHYRSRPELPSRADVVVVGAGLTGASAAYHLSEAARNQDLRVVVVDKGAPASEASGRNGGNFELLPENSVGIYEGLARERFSFLRRCYPAVPIEILRTESERQASVVLGFALRNRDRLKHIIEQENIDCDFSPKGWLYLAHTEREEQAICEEVMFAAEQGQRIELWSRMKIRNEFGFRRDYIGRFIPGDGSYHPFNYVYGVFESALRSGVELYTGFKVCQITSSNEDSHSVVTDAGTIVARRVIVATNAFTHQIFPELGAMRPAESQIAVTEFAPDRCRGRIVTSEEGPVYFNQPRAGARNGLAPLLLGGGSDRPIANPSSRRRSAKIHSKLLLLREKFYPELKNRPFSTEWVGSCAYTPDQLPAVGFLRPGIIVAAGYNGYGGSYTCAAGQAAAMMALTGQTPEWVPQDVFSPKRLLGKTPLFMDETDSLWRIAASLCAQLRAVNRQISDAISFSGTTAARFSAAGHSVPPPDHTQSTPTSTVNPELLRALPAFSDFTLSESQALLSMMCRWDLPKGTLLFSHGSPGRSCFIVLSGAVNVSMQVRGQEQLLATLPAGSIFGQVALIEGCPRTTTCTIHKDAILLEVDREPCERLFASRSVTALKFLAALNQGLISALRGADRQLMRLTIENRVPWSADAAV